MIASLLSVIWSVTSIQIEDYCYTYLFSGSFTKSDILNCEIQRKNAMKVWRKAFIYCNNVLDLVSEAVTLVKEIMFWFNAYRFASVKDSNNLTTNTMSGVFEGNANSACRISPNIPTGISDFTNCPTFCAPISLRSNRRSHMSSGLHCRTNSTVVVGTWSSCCIRIKNCSIMSFIFLPKPTILISDVEISNVTSGCWHLSRYFQTLQKYCCSCSSYMTLFSITIGLTNLPWVFIHIYIYRVSQEEGTKLRESVP